MDHADNDQHAPKYRIGLVSRLTGVSAHQLRIWERRYQTVTPVRSDGGDRLYSDSDVQRLRVLKQLSDRGHSIGQIARLAEAELAQLLEATPDTETKLEGPRLGRKVREQFLDRIEHMDLLSAERTLGRACVAFEPRELMTDVILPVLREVGRRWEAGSFSVAQEHAASSVLRTQLGALMRLYTPDVGARVVVCATLAFELHELGALAAGLCAASRAWRVIYLGPNLPTREIAKTASSTRAELLLISCVLLQPDLGRELSDLRAQVPRRVRIIVGGEAAKTLSGLPDGIEVLETIEDLDDVL